MHQTLEKSMFFLLLKKNYSISILHGSESLPVVVITIHPPKGRQATPKGQPKDGEVYFICGYDILSGMPDRGLKGAKAPSQVSKVSR